MAEESLEAFRIDALMMGGLAAPAAPMAPAPAQAGKRDAGYPTIEGICAKKANFESFSAAVARTVQGLEAEAASGNADARKAIKAFDHMSDLVSTAVERTIAEIKRLRDGR